MLQRIINKYFYNYKEGEFSVNRTAFKDLFNSFKYKFESRIVCLSDIYGAYIETPCDELNFQDTTYNWDKLRESLIKDKYIDIFHIYELSERNGRYYMKRVGTDVSDHQNPLLDKMWWKNTNNIVDNDIVDLQPFLYAISDGNHRLALLKCLYGLNHKVTIHLNPILRKSFFVSLILFIIDRYKNSKRLLKILLKLIIPSYQDPLYNTYENTKNIKNTYYLYGYKERLKEVKNKTYKPHDK